MDTANMILFFKYKLRVHVLSVCVLRSHHFPPSYYLKCFLSAELFQSLKPVRISLLSCNAITL